MEHETPICLQGSVKQYQVFCKEMPFFVNNNGDIAYRESYDVIIEIYGRTCKYSHELVHALNDAYKRGYEMDRVIWK
jgi:hypothetical protein